MNSHENPSRGSRIPCRRTDMTKIIVAFRNFANAPGTVKCEFVNTRVLYSVARTHLNSTNADVMYAERHQPALFVAIISSCQVY